MEKIFLWFQSTHRQKLNMTNTVILDVPIWGNNCFWQKFYCSGPKMFLREGVGSTEITQYRRNFDGCLFVFEIEFK